MLFNRPQGLDCTCLGSVARCRSVSNPALRTLTTSTFRSEEEEGKGSLPACPSWVVSACLAIYIGYVPMCQSVHARGGIHTTTTLSLRNLCELHQAPCQALIRADCAMWPVRKCLSRSARPLLGLLLKQSRWPTEIGPL